MSYQIGGIQVEFPFKPYEVQHEFMATLIKSLENSENCLLENPTGTGKTLSLLCASLAWQMHYKERKAGEYWEKWRKNQDPSAGEETKVFGEFSVSLNYQQNKEKAVKVIHTPRIYYSTRVHTQIANVVKELRKSNYHPRMSILGSRQQYCINPALSYSKTKNEDCLDNLRTHQCEFMEDEFKSGQPHEFQFEPPEKNTVRLARKLINIGIWDIEDAIGEGRKGISCPYYTSQLLAESAEIVFCPYNYVLDRNIRSKSNIHIKDNIFIFDEAHNIEDASRTSASFSADAEVLLKWKEDLDKALAEFEDRGKEVKGSKALPLIVESMHAWIRKTKIKEHRKDTFANVYEKKTLESILCEWGVTKHTIYTISKSWDETYDTVNGIDAGLISPKTATEMSQLLSTLKYCLSEFLEDYRLIITQTKDRHILFNLACLNPRVSFSAFKDGAKSVILTSGTLSPLNGFQGELEMEFPNIYEGVHVIDMKKQICAHAVKRGSNSVELALDYKNANSPEVQIGVGNIVERYCKTVKAGVLCFFPSYTMMESMFATWRENKIMENISVSKVIYKEPRKMDDPDEFTRLLERYDDTIEEFDEDSNEDITGAIFFAVCRGKVSEGLDFSDNKARAVIVIGIPFPPLMDMEIELKREFNDALHKKDKKYLNGQQWYSQQAYRAVNQAVGRCIRHQNDYGAIILVDKRYTQWNAIQSLSKWIRPAIVSMDADESVSSVKAFFQRIRNITPKIRPHITIESDEDSRKRHKFNE